MGDAMIWDEKHIADLRRMSAEGMSCTQMGRVFGVTRNAVVGACYRNKVELKYMATASERKRSSMLARQNAIAARRREAQAAKKVRKMTPERVVTLQVVRADARTRFEQAAALALAPRPWVTREFSECAFPIEKSDQTYSCCNETHGLTYCSAHLSVMRIPTPALRVAA